MNYKKLIMAFGMTLAFIALIAFAGIGLAALVSLLPRNMQGIPLVVTGVGVSTAMIYMIIT